MASILVIEDDRPIRKIYRAMLENANHTVFDASNGKIGIETYKENPTDLVITDLIMPELDGIGVLMELKLKENSPNAKIIIISGSIGCSDDLGADYVLYKPVCNEDLLKAVDQVLQQE